VTPSPPRARPWLAVVAFALSASAATAHAEGQPSGAVTGHALFSDQAWGGALVVDVTAPFGALRVGGALAVAALTSDDDARSRVAMPAGLSLHLVVPTASAWWLDVRARAGLWGGATSQGLRAGAWLAGGGFVGFVLGPTVAVAAGAELWFLGGQGDTFGVAPGISLTWTPISDE
jgi:hypothetical protein